MTAPTAGDLVVADSQAKRSEVRVILGLDYPALTAEKTEDFSTGLPSADFWHLALAPEAMLTDVNGIHFRSWSAPAFEVLKTREHWFPDDPAQPFKLVINMKFPTADPVYSPMIVVGGLENEFGELNDIATVVQHGSAMTKTTSIGATNEGDFLVYSNNTLTPVNVDAYDALSHELIVEWDPAKAVNTFKVTVKWDASTVKEYDTPLARPMYVAMGWTWPVLVEPDSDPKSPVEILAPGTVGVPVTVMTIEDITMTQLATEGYETRVFPGWTSANAGGTIDTAVPGERFTIGGVNVAKIDPKRIEDLSGERGRSILFDTLNFTVLGQQELDADPVDLFEDTRFVNRELWFDTRHENITTGLFSSWLRQGMMRIKSSRKDERKSGIATEVEGRSDVMDKLDSFIDIGFLGEISEADIDENLYPFDITIDELLTAIITVSNSISGALTDTDSTVRVIDIQPDIIASGGNSLLNVFAELIDQIAYEFWCEYKVSGAERDGSIRIHAWTLGTGTGTYTFEASNGLLVGTRINLNSVNAPNHVNYRSNIPLFRNNEAVNSKHLPTVGTFPTHPYPSRGTPLVDTLSFAHQLSATSLLALKDVDDVSISGGVATHRYRLENTQRRIISFEVAGHDWIEPGDEISVLRPGMVAAADSWIVDSFSYEFSDGVWKTQVEALTTDWLDAIRQTV